MLNPINTFIVTRDFPLTSIESYRNMDNIAYCYIVYIIISVTDIILFIRLHKMQRVMNFALLYYYTFLLLWNITIHSIFPHTLPSSMIVGPNVKKLKIITFSNENNNFHQPLANLIFDCCNNNIYHT